MCIFLLVLACLFSYSNNNTDTVINITIHVYNWDSIKKSQKAYMNSPSFNRHWWVVGWFDGAGIRPVLERPTNLDYRRARAYCACSRCEWGLFGHFFSRLSFLFSLSFSLGDGSI